MNELIRAEWEQPLPEWPGATMPQVDAKHTARMNEAYASFTVYLSLF
jgi:hypothetical protein